MDGVAMESLQAPHAKNLMRSLVISRQNQTWKRRRRLSIWRFVSFEVGVSYFLPIEA